MSNVSIQNTVNTWGKRPYLFIKGEQFKKNFSTFFFSHFFVHLVSQKWVSFIGVGFVGFCGLFCGNVVFRMNDDVCCHFAAVVRTQSFLGFDNHQCKCSQYDIVYCPTLTVLLL